MAPNTFKFALRISSIEANNFPVDGQKTQDKKFSYDTLFTEVSGPIHILKVHWTKIQHVIINFIKSPPDYKCSIYDLAVEDCQTLIEPMLRRISDLLKAKGGYSATCLTNDIKNSTISMILLLKTKLTYGKLRNSLGIEKARKISFPLLSVNWIKLVDHFHYFFLIIFVQHSFTELLFSYIFLVIFKIYMLHVFKKLKWQPWVRAFVAFNIVDTFSKQEYLWLQFCEALLLTLPVLVFHREAMSTKRHAFSLAHAFKI